MTRTPNPAEARGTGTESTKSPTGTWSAILSRTISVTTSWFPASFFLLGINNHVEVSHVVHVTHPCRQFPLSWSFTCAFWRPFQHSKGQLPLDGAVCDTTSRCQGTSPSCTPFPAKSVPHPDIMLYVAPHLWVKEPTGRTKHILRCQVKMINYTTC